MTFQPLFVLFGALLFATLFEVFFAFLGRSDAGGHNKQEWAMIYWFIVIVVLFCCKVIRPDVPLLWLPGFIVAAIHSFTDFDFDLANWRKPPQAGNLSSSIPKSGSSGNNSTNDQRGSSNTRSTEDEME